MLRRGSFERSGRARGLRCRARERVDVGGGIPTSAISRPSQASRAAALQRYTSSPEIALAPEPGIRRRPMREACRTIEPGGALDGRTRSLSIVE
jgi:hypothetical protein